MFRVFRVKTICLPETPPDSDLPRLDAEKLERWGRLRLLVPPGGGYELTDLERTLALLMLERALNFEAYRY